MAELKDDETRMVRFDRLSEERKAEIRKKAQDEMREAEAQRKRPLTSRIADKATEFHPFLPKRMKEEHAQIAAKNVAERESRFQRAQQEAALTDAERAKRQRLYSDTRVHKIDPDQPLKTGGKVRGYAKGGKIDGCAQRGKTRGKTV